METTRTVELLITARWSCKKLCQKGNNGRISAVLPRKILHVFVQKKKSKTHKNHQHKRKCHIEDLWSVHAPCVLGRHRLCRNVTAAAARNLGARGAGWTCHFSCDCFEWGSSLAITAQFSSKKWWASWRLPWAGEFSALDLASFLWWVISEKKHKLLIWQIFFSSRFKKKNTPCLSFFGGESSLDPKIVMQILWRSLPSAAPLGGAPWESVQPGATATEGHIC